MEPNETHDEVVVDDVEETNEEVVENTEEAPKEEKPKRTPQEEYEYHMGRAKRLAKKHGIEAGEKPEPKPEVKNSSKPNDTELGYGEKAYLKAFGIQGADELQLVKSEIKRSGLELDELVSNEYFMGKVKSLREARESANAVPKSKNRSGQMAVTDLDVAVAKYKETGELPGDFTTRNKVIDAITKSESSALFSGPSIVSS